MNKKASWIRIAEAFISIMLIISILTIIVKNNYPNKGDASSKIYERETAVLREIELNKTLRNEILSPDMLPVNWTDINFPENVKNKINEETQDYLECEGKICEIDVACELDVYPEEEIFVQSVFIAGNLTKYAPRQLRLFCWMK